MGVARRLGVPVVVYAQGVGPLRRPWLRRLAAAGPSGGAAEMTVRDRLSCDDSVELGVDPARIPAHRRIRFCFGAGDPGPDGEAARGPAAADCRRGGLTGERAGRPARPRRPAVRQAEAATPGPPWRPARRSCVCGLSRAGRRRRDEPGAGRPGRGTAASPGRVGRLHSAAPLYAAADGPVLEACAGSWPRRGADFTGRLAGGLV